MIKDILSYVYASFDTFIIKVIYWLNVMQLTNRFRIAQTVSKGLSHKLRRNKYV